MEKFDINKYVNERAKAVIEQKPKKKEQNQKDEYVSPSSSNKSGLSSLGNWKHRWKYIG